jgi:hypothetical protein
MFPPDDYYWYPQEGGLAAEVKSLFTESLAGPNRALQPFLSDEKIEEYSVRIAEFVDAFLRQYPSKTDWKLSLFCDMVSLSFSIPDDQGAFLLVTKTHDQVSGGNIRIDAFIHEVPRDDKMVMVRIVIEQSLAVIARQLQQSVQRIRQGADEEGDAAFLRALGGRNTIIQSLQNYIYGQQQVSVSKLNELIHRLLTEVLSPVKGHPPKLLHKPAMDKRLELVHTEVVNALFAATPSHLAIVAGDIALATGVHLPNAQNTDGFSELQVQRRGQAEPCCAWSGLSFTEEEFPDALVEFFQELFRQMDEHRLWEWTDVNSDHP